MRKFKRNRLCKERRRERRISAFLNMAAELMASTMSGWGVSHPFPNLDDIEDAPEVEVIVQNGCSVGPTVLDNLCPCGSKLYLGVDSKCPKCRMTPNTKHYPGGFICLDEMGDMPEGAVPSNIGEGTLERFHGRMSMASTDTDAEK